mgnify:CR=1 FL=1
MNPNLAHAWARIISGMFWVVAACCAPAAAEPGVVLIAASDGSAARVTALSQSGAAAVGYTFPDTPSVYLQGFVWSQANGRQDVTETPAPYGVEARSVDSSGAMFAGTHVSTRNGPYRAFRRDVGATANELLPLISNYTRGFGRGISGDGRAVVGYCERGPNTYWDAQAFIWREGVGTIPLGFARPGSIISDARAISRDGSTVVGVSIDGSLTGEAFTWTESGGMRVLNGLPNALYPDTFAQAVSADGRVTVGQGYLPSGLSTVLMWRDESPEAISLGTLGLNNGIAPTDVSDDGSVAVGYAVFPSIEVPFVWTASTGMIALDSYLNQFGVTAPSGVTLRRLYAVSGDGLTFAGDARLDSGITVGFVATIPAPGSVVVFGVLAVVRRRR